MIAVTAMLLLSLGDTVSGLVGSVLAKADVRSRKEMWCCKPMPIVVAMFTACLLIGYLASGITQLSFPVYFAGAVGATFADCVAIVIRNKGLDDNFSIPIFSGLLMSAAAFIASNLAQAARKGFLKYGIVSIQRSQAANSCLVNGKRRKDNGYYSARSTGIR